MKKIAVFGGDLFWSNLPYELLNYYEKLNKKYNVDLLLFEKDIRLNKKFVGYEKFFFDSKKYTDCENLVIIKNWEEFYKISANYSEIFCSCKIAPKTRFPYDFKEKIKTKITVWDTGGTDILTDSHYIANNWITKGSVFKDYLLVGERTTNVCDSENVQIGECPLYERYFNNEIVHGKLLDKKSFLDYYGLDVDKKTILVCPTNPSSHTKQLRDNIFTLESILSEAENLNIQVILKTYPHDYVFYEKNYQYSSVYRRENALNHKEPQYKTLIDNYKSLTLIESQDHHESILYSDLLFNMAGSSIAWETYYSDCVSFSNNFVGAEYYDAVKYLPGFVLPNSKFNLNLEDYCDVPMANFLQKLLKSDNVNISNKNMCKKYFS